MDRLLVVCLWIVVDFWWVPIVVVIVPLSRQYMHEYRKGADACEAIRAVTAQRTSPRTCGLGILVILGVGAWKQKYLRLLLRLN